jgi:hypothetical protein
MKERKPAVVQVYLELEDNCGAVIAKKRVEVPVTFAAKGLPDEPTIIRLFEEWATQLKADHLELGM